MNYNFLNIFLDKKDLLNQDNSTINPFLLQNNAAQVEKLYKFYSGNVNLAFVTGFLGTGKMDVTKYSLSLLAPEVIVFKYTCFQSTILDDILLAFYVEFKKLFSKKVVEEPKFRSENFAQKINTYFSKIEKPFVIILDSFNDIQKENKQEIFDFAQHLSTLGKVKIVIISKAFPSELFNGKDIKYERIQVFALEQGIFEKYLKSGKVKFTSSQLEKFYSNTRGYFFFTSLAIKYMQYSNENLEVFFDRLGKSFMSFDSYIEKKSEEMVPATSRNLFWFVSLIRHGASINLLKKMGLYDESVVNSLIERGLFIKEDENIYVREYFKENLDVSMAVNIAQKIHQFIISLYENQLPLKPLERDIPISRQTMRKEIDYHRLFLPKRPQTAVQDFDANYVSYAKGLDFDLSRLSGQADAKTPPKLDKRFLEMKAKKEEEMQFKKVKNPNLNLSSLAGAMSSKEIEKPDDKAFVSKSEDSVQKPKSSLTYRELIINATIAEEDYKYSKALNLYLQALENGKDKVSNKVLADIYTKIAHCYQKLSNNDDALKNYYKAQDLFTDEKDYIQANYIKLSVSRLLYESYKFELAREYALDIIKYENNPSILKVKAYIQLSYIEDGFSNTQKSYDYTQKALAESNDSMDAETLAELYFRYALSQDDKGDIDMAIDYYKKSAEASSNPETNKFLSSAYSNIASLYYERGNVDFAVENYLKSHKIDTEKDNFEGIYYSASKLAALLQRKNPQEALKYYQSALSASKKLNDVFYVAEATLALGDFYYNTRQNENALRQYILAQKIAQEHFSAENKARIDMRLNDLKVKMGESAYNSAFNKLKEE